MSLRLPASHSAPNLDGDAEVSNSERKAAGGASNKRDPASLIPAKPFPAKVKLKL